MTGSTKTHETRLRRAADRQGFALRKSRRRDERALDFGEVWLLKLSASNPERSWNAWIGPFESLDEVEHWLDADPNKRGRDSNELADWRGY